MIKSFNEKIVTAFNLSHELADKIENNLLKVSEQTESFIYGHADGLTAKRLYNLRDGLCSMRMMIDFNPEKEEKRIDDDILFMTNLLKYACDEKMLKKLNTKRYGKEKAF